MKGKVQAEADYLWVWDKRERERESFRKGCEVLGVGYGNEWEREDVAVCGVEIPEKRKEQEHNKSLAFYWKCLKLKSQQRELTLFRISFIFVFSYYLLSIIPFPYTKFFSFPHDFFKISCLPHLFLLSPLSTRSRGPFLPSTMDSRRAGHSLHWAGSKTCCGVNYWPPLLTTLP